MGSKRKTIILIVAILALILLLVGLISVPTIIDVSKIKQQIYLQRVDLEKKYLRSQVLKKILRDYEELKPEKEKFDGFFIPFNQELEFVTKIEEIASSHNIKQEISIKNSTFKNEIYQIMTVTVKLEGKFHEILGYIRDTQKQNNQFNITSLILSGNKPETIMATITGEIYIFKK